MHADLSSSKNKESLRNIINKLKMILLRNQTTLSLKIDLRATVDSIKNENTLKDDIFTSKMI